MCYRNIPTLILPSRMNCAQEQLKAHAVNGGIVIFVYTPSERAYIALDHKTMMDLVVWIIQHEAEIAWDQEVNVPTLTLSSRANCTKGELRVHAVEGGIVVFVYTFPKKDATLDVSEDPRALRPLSANIALDHKTMMELVVWITRHKEALAWDQAVADSVTPGRK